MKGYIYETLNAVSKDKMSIKRDGGFMTLSGTFGVCGVRNNNQRVYGLANYKKMVDEMNERLKTESIMGELEHPNTMNITLENVSHLIESISIDEQTGEVRGTIKLLDTPKGKIAQAIVEGGADLFISSRAMGDVDAQGNVTLEMLKTYDLVGTPGFSQAKLKLNESLLCESMMFQSAPVDENKNDVVVNNVEQSINEYNMNNQNDEKVQALERKVDRLERVIEGLKDSIASNNVSLTESIQDMLQEYSIKLEKWTENELIPECKEQTITEMAPLFESWAVNQLCPEVQKWICEHYTECVQNWIFGQFSPNVENWMNEHFSGSIKEWVANDYTGNLQTWLTEEFGGGIQKWVSEELEPSMKNYVDTEAPKTKLQSTLSAVDEMLKVVESNDNSNKKKIFESAVVTENENEPLFIQKMPASARVKWNMAPANVKDMIMRKARIYSFTNESAIEQFWNEQDFVSVSVNENQQSLNNIQDPWERNMRSLLRRRF